MALKIRLARASTSGLSTMPAPPPQPRPLLHRPKHLPKKQLRNNRDSVSPILTDGRFAL